VRYIPLAADFLSGKSASRVYWADTVDADYTYAIYQACKKVLMGGGTMVLVIVSKSGTTTETLAHAQLF
jgi:glucose-6-phosphate isomerase